MCLVLGPPLRQRACSSLAIAMKRRAKAVVKMEASGESPAAKKVKQEHVKEDKETPKSVKQDQSLLVHIGCMCGGGWSYGCLWPLTLFVSICPTNPLNDETQHLVNVRVYPLVRNSGRRQRMVGAGRCQTHPKKIVVPRPKRLRRSRAV